MNGSGRGYDGAGTSNGFTFNTCLASLHTYLGGEISCLVAFFKCLRSASLLILRFYFNLTDVEDTHHRVAFLEGGAILNLPIFYLEGMNSFLYRLHFCIHTIQFWLFLHVVRHLKKQ